MGFEPTTERVTVVCVNRFTTATIKIIHLVRLRGFEPLTYGLEVRCSIQLSYRRKMVGVRGFEPPAPCSQGRCASQAALRPELNKLQDMKIKSQQKQHLLFVIST